LISALNDVCFGEKPIKVIISGLKGVMCFSLNAFAVSSDCFLVSLS